MPPIGPLQLVEGNSIISPLSSNDDYGILANDAKIDNYSSSIYPNLEMPAAGMNGIIQTLNQTGFMLPENNEYTEAFIRCANLTKKPILDIGASYGVVTIQALKKNGTAVIANDIEERHLLLLRERTPVPYWPSLYLNNKAFPHDIDFPENSLGAVLASRIFHFLTPEEMEIGLNKITKWLVKGGHICIVTMSPYRTYLTDKNYMEVYNKAWESGNDWPGVIPDIVTKYAPHFRGQIPEYMHAMDERPLERALLKRGFKIIKSGLFDFQNIWNYCGVVAIKI